MRKERRGEEDKQIETMEEPRERWCNIDNMKDR